jgi:hypothetical protein
MLRCWLLKQMVHIVTILPQSINVTDYISSREYFAIVQFFSCISVQFVSNVYTAQWCSSSTGNSARANLRAAASFSVWHLTEPFNLSDDVTGSNDLNPDLGLVAILGSHMFLEEMVTRCDKYSIMCWVIGRGKQVALEIVDWACCYNMCT